MILINIDIYSETYCFVLFAVQENDVKGNVQDEMTDKEVDSVSYTQRHTKDISEVGGGYLSADEQP